MRANLYGKLLDISEAGFGVDFVKVGGKDLARVDSAGVC